MDTHTFSTPRPVQDAKNPTWIVDILRGGVGEPIATLTVNNESLPPRKNRKKVLWKLPDSYDQEPRFGDHEKKRLWEMFKLQKKLRRKSKKGAADSVSSAPVSTSGESTSTDSTVATVEDNVKEDPLKSSSKTKSKESSETTPPPGFLANLRVDDSKHNANPPGSPHLPAKNIPSIVPPPGLTSTSTPQASLTQSAAVAAPPTAISGRSFPNNPPHVLGDFVAQALITCLGNHQMNVWVEYMAPNFQKTMVVGTAQASCCTHDAAILQWENIQRGKWEIQGRTTQIAGASLLLVLTGKTIQTNNTVLSFQQTIILGQQADAGWRITNEVLNLLPST